MAEQQSVEGRKFNKRVAGLFAFLLTMWNRPPKSSLHKQQDEADKALLIGFLHNVEASLSELR